MTSVPPIDPPCAECGAGEGEPCVGPHSADVEGEEHVYAIGDRVQWTSSSDGGMSRRQVGPIEGTVAEIMDSGRVCVDWDKPFDRKYRSIPIVVWPADIEPVDAVSRLGDLLDDGA